MVTVPALAPKLRFTAADFRVCRTCCKRTTSVGGILACDKPVGIARWLPSLQSALEVEALEPQPARVDLGLKPRADVRHEPIGPADKHDRVVERWHIVEVGGAEPARMDTTPVPTCTLRLTRRVEHAHFDVGHPVD